MGTEPERRPPGSHRRPRGWIGVALACLACLPYLESFGYGFVDYDDPRTIVGLPLIRELSIATLPGFFEPTIYEGLPEYMPLKNLSYAVDYALFGLSAPGFRLQQQLWYVLSVLGLFAWLRELLRQRTGDRAYATRVALISAALFAVHPAHVESVAWLSGRKDVLSGALVFASLYAALRWPGRGSAGRGWLALALGCAGLALLGKPTALVLPGLLLLQDLAGTGPRQWRATLAPRLALHLGVAAMCVAFATLYLSLTASHAQANAGNEWRHFEGPGPLRWGQQLGLLLQMALWPVRLSVVHPPDVMNPELLSWPALLGLLLLLGLLTGLVAALLRGSRWALPLGLFLIPLGPVVLTPAWEQYVAGRYLFHAAAGACLALALAGDWLAQARPRLRRLLGASCVALVISWSASTFQYARTFRDGLSLWQNTLAVYPQFAWPHTMAARAALARGEVQGSFAVLEHCLEVAPDDAGCLSLLGKLLLPVDPSRGEALLRRALLSDVTGDAHLFLAEELARSGRARQGAALYAGWLAGRPTNAARIGALARLQLAAGEATRALATARQALAAASVNAPASPPPVGLLLQAARDAGREDLVERLQQTSRSCARADCFAHTMRW